MGSLIIYRISKVKLKIIVAYSFPSIRNDFSRFTGLSDHNNSNARFAQPRQEQMEELNPNHKQLDEELMRKIFFSAHSMAIKTNCSYGKI